MSKNLYSPPEEFAVSPLFQLLPVRESLTQLKTLHSSLFARYEKVQLQITDLNNQTGNTEHRNIELKNLNSEEVMLKQVMEWIEENSK